MLGHELKRVYIKTKSSGEYLCSCGARGGATMAAHLASRTELEKRLVKNHEMHRVRSLIRENRR